MHSDRPKVDSGINNELRTILEQDNLEEFKKFLSTHFEILTGSLINFKVDSNLLHLKSASLWSIIIKHTLSIKITEYLTTKKNQTIPDTVIFGQLQMIGLFIQSKAIGMQVISIPDIDRTLLKPSCYLNYVVTHLNNYIHRQGDFLQKRQEIITKTIEVYQESIKLFDHTALSFEQDSMMINFNNVLENLHTIICSEILLNLQDYIDMTKLMGYLYETLLPISSIYQAIHNSHYFYRYPELAMLMLSYVSDQSFYILYRYFYAQKIVDNLDSQDSLQSQSLSSINNPNSQSIQNLTQLSKLFKPSKLFTTPTQRTHSCNLPERNEVEIDNYPNLNNLNNQNRSACCKIL